MGTYTYSFLHVLNTFKPRTPLNLLPDKKILDWSKLRQIAAVSILGRGIAEFTHFFQTNARHCCIKFECRTSAF